MTEEQKKKVVRYEQLALFHDLSVEEMQDYVQKNSGKVLSGTTEYWSAQATLVSAENIIYYYSDVKNIKIGDGKTLLVSLPFILDRDKWDKVTEKCSYSIDNSTGVLTLTQG